MEADQGWWAQVSECAWMTDASCYWGDQHAAVEVEIPLPDTRRGQKQMLQNMEGFFVGTQKAGG
jgi:hypothetical protein